MEMFTEKEMKLIGESVEYCLIMVKNEMNKLVGNINGEHSDELAMKLWDIAGTKFELTKLINKLNVIKNEMAYKGVEQH